MPIRCHGLEGSYPLDGQPVSGIVQVCADIVDQQHRRLYGGGNGYFCGRHPPTSKSGMGGGIAALRGRRLGGPAAGYFQRKGSRRADIEPFGLPGRWTSRSFQPKRGRLGEDHPHFAGGFFRIAEAIEVSASENELVKRGRTREAGNPLHEHLLDICDDAGRAHRPAGTEVHHPFHEPRAGDVETGAATSEETEAAVKRIVASLGRRRCRPGLSGLYREPDSAAHDQRGGFRLVDVRDRADALPSTKTASLIMGSRIRFTIKAGSLGRHRPLP